MFSKRMGKWDNDLGCHLLCHKDILRLLARGWHACDALRDALNGHPKLRTIRCYGIMFHHGESTLVLYY